LTRYSIPDFMNSLATGPRYLFVRDAWVQSLYAIGNLF
jgi:hypothetical protein